MKALTNLINNEVHINASAMVAQLIGHGCLTDKMPETLEDLQNATIGPTDLSELPEDYRVVEDDDDGWRFEWFHYDEPAGWIASDSDWYETEREAVAAAWEDAGDEPPCEEVFEHWIVSDFLADELEEIGAPIACDVLGFNIWGRCETGQGLDSDHHLNEVARRIQARCAAA